MSSIVIRVFVPIAGDLSKRVRCDHDVSVSDVIEQVKQVLERKAAVSRAVLKSKFGLWHSDFGRLRDHEIISKVLHNMDEVEMRQIQKKPVAGTIKSLDQLNNSSKIEPPAEPLDHDNNFAEDDKRFPMLSPRSGSQAKTLHDAANQGDLDRVRDFIASSAPLDLQDAHGNSALMWAAALGHSDVTEELVQAGCDVNVRAKDGATALRFAAEKGHKQIVAQLLDAGADPNVIDKFGSTALSAACKAGHKKIVYSLLKANADTNSSPCVLQAARKGHFSIVKALVAAGANPGQKTKSGKKAHQLAATKEIVRFLKEQEIQFRNNPISFVTESNRNDKELPLEPIKLKISMSEADSAAPSAAPRPGSRVKFGGVDVVEEPAAVSSDDMINVIVMVELIRREKQISVSSNASVRSLRAAVAAWAQKRIGKKREGVVDFTLFRPSISAGWKPLPDDMLVKDSGVETGDTLLLRETRLIGKRVLSSRSARAQNNGSSARVTSAATSTPPATGASNEVSPPSPPVAPSLPPLVFTSSEAPARIGGSQQQQQQKQQQHNQHAVIPSLATENLYSRQETRPHEPVPLAGALSPRGPVVNYGRLPPAPGRPGSGDQYDKDDQNAVFRKLTASSPVGRFPQQQPPPPATKPPQALVEAAARNREQQPVPPEGDGDDDGDDESFSLSSETEDVPPNRPPPASPRDHQPPPPSQSSSHHQPSAGVNVITVESISSSRMSPSNSPPSSPPADRRPKSGTVSGLEAFLAAGKKKGSTILTTGDPSSPPIIERVNSGGKLKKNEEEELVGRIMEANESWRRVATERQIRQPIRVTDSVELLCLYARGFTKESKPIKWLWQVVTEMSTAEKNMFLEFISTESGPCINLSVQSMGSDEDRIPMFFFRESSLLLPSYSSKKKLKDGLFRAIAQ